MPDGSVTTIVIGPVMVVPVYDMPSESTEVPPFTSDSVLGASPPALGPM